MRIVGGSLSGALGGLLHSVHEARRVADGISDGLKVSLDGLHGAVIAVRRCDQGMGNKDDMLTEVACRVPCRLSCQAHRQREHSRQLAEPNLVLLLALHV